MICTLGPIWKKLIPKQEVNTDLTNRDKFTIWPVFICSVI